MITVNVKCFSQVMYALDTDILLLELELGTTTDILENIYESNPPKPTSSSSVSNPN